MAKKRPFSNPARLRNELASSCCSRRLALDARDQAVQLLLVLFKAVLDLFALTLHPGAQSAAFHLHLAEVAIEEERSCRAAGSETAMPVSTGKNLAA